MTYSSFESDCLLIQRGATGSISTNFAVSYTFSVVHFSFLLIWKLKLSPLLSILMSYRLVRLCWILSVQIFTHCTFISYICMWSECAKCIPWMHHADYAFLLSYSKHRNRSSIECESQSTNILLCKTSKIWITEKITEKLSENETNSKKKSMDHHHQLPQG